MNRLRKPVMLKVLAALVLTVILIPQFGMLAQAKKPTSDTQPPTAPQSLTAASTSQTAVTLKWSPSTDNKGIASYHIYKNSVNLASVTGTSYTVSGLTPATTYSFFVKAKDLSGNLSLSSNVLRVTTSAPSVPVQPTKIISGYYGSWAAYSGYTPLNIPASKLTHINYAFANIGSDLKIALGDPNIDPSNFSKLNELKKTHSNLKTLISVGGWDFSGKFSDVALTDSSRTVFADSVVTFIKQYGLNGVDIDWEFPVGGGLSTNINRPEDKTNFTLLLKKLREKLDAQESVDGQNYILTIAGGAGTSYVSNTELSILSNYVDYATIMSYDIHGTWDTYTDFNASLYSPLETSPQYKWSVDSAVKSWISAGFPASEIVLGVPFYGYLYNGVPNVNNGLYQRFTSGNSIFYDNIASTYLTNSTYVKRTHPDSRTPYLFNGSTFISYDDEQSIAEKARYIQSSGLAGASAWELSQNKNGVLLNALYSNLN